MHKLLMHYLDVREKSFCFTPTCSPQRLWWNPVHWLLDRDEIYRQMLTQHHCTDMRRIIQQQELLVI